jgi:hypothetical protein
LKLRKLVELEAGYAVGLHGRWRWLGRLWRRHDGDWCKSMPGVDAELTRRTETRARRPAPWPAVEL